MGVTDGFKPLRVLTYFEEICSIPHGSGNIDQISDYLVSFAKEHNLRYRQDEAKNVIIFKDGTPGYENSPAVIIQGHMDMVAVKTPDCTKNLEKEGLDLEIVDGHWLSAKGTSLGGDDGIAVAYGLALLASDRHQHPPIELVITVNEEIGLLGAAELDCSDLQGRIMLNIDSEDEGIFTVSCAGGMTAIGKLPYAKEIRTGTVIRLTLSGFKGGHSGSEIHLGRLNSNVALGRILYSLGEPAMGVISVSGGEKDNAIANRSMASILVPDEACEKVLQMLDKTLNIIKKEYAAVEGVLKADYRVEHSVSVSCMTQKSTADVLCLLLNLPNGIQRMNPDVEGFVQTSINLGVLATTDNEVMCTMSLRSSIETEKRFLLDRVTSLFKSLGGEVKAEGDYPGWAYSPESHVRDVMVKVFKEQYMFEPKVLGIHAGLECGLFASKMEGLDCISFGPQMHHIHTTDEMLDLHSVERTWRLLRETLSRLR